MKILISALMLLLVACTNVVSRESTFSFEEEVDGMGAWDWKGFESSHADSQLWRQIDHYFSFAYPAKWNLEETLNEIVISDGEFEIKFLAPQPKEEADLKTVKDYCLNQINGSDQEIVEERDLVLGAEDAFWVSFDSSAGKEWTGDLICVDLGDSWMWIKASPLDESYDAKFENILGSLSFAREE